MLICHGVIDVETLPRARAALDRAGAQALMPSALRLRWIPVDALALLVSETPLSASELATLLGSPEAAGAVAAAHNRLLSALIPDIDILPARLSGAFLSEQAVIDDAHARRAALTAALRRIGGAAEYSVRLTATQRKAAPTRPATITTKDGRSYLQTRLAKRRSGALKRAGLAELIDALSAASQLIARETVETRGPSERRPELRLDLALLLDRGAEPSLVALGERFSTAAEDQGLELTLIGPWAPFSFADAPAELAEEAPAEDPQAAEAQAFLDRVAAAAPTGASNAGGAAA